MGILSNGKMHIASRPDLIGDVLGRTAILTQTFINKCIGGVMFIDEAYELGHDSGDDHYSKECIDTINRNLSEHRDLLVIVAGYAEDLEECFFKHNAGLQRRFVFRYDINGYTSKELLEIFKLKVRNDEWSIDCADKVLEDFFKKNHKVFTNFGGDIETFLLNCKIEHSKRVLFEGSKKVLNLVDIKNGLSTFTKYRKPDASKSVGDALCELLNIKPKSDNKITHTIYTKA
jgi:hypothetical protein